MSPIIQLLEVENFSLPQQTASMAEKTHMKGPGPSHLPEELDGDEVKGSGLRKASLKAAPPPRQTAKVKELAEEKTSDHVATEVEANILTRIRKCLDRANHPNTPEMEAKAALHMSSRLMAQYNVTQADVLAQATDSGEQKQYAGQSTVSISSTKDRSAKVISQTWVHGVASAMMMFFDCKSYSTALKFSIEWTFYGIAPNTAAAAIAFEMAHNLILEWARGKKSAVNSYCLGVANGLLEMAREEKRQEEREAKKREQEDLSVRLQQEQLERQKELDRLHVDVGTAETQKTPSAVPVGDEDIIQPGPTISDNASGYDHSSSDSDDEVGCIVFDNETEEETEAQPTFKVEQSMPLDPEADFEAELQRILKRKRSSSPVAKIKSEDTTSQAEVAGCLSGLLDVKPKLEDDEPPTENSLWASASQLTLFRATAQKIAEEYIKSTNTKLTTGRAPVSSVRDYGAYEQGKKDSRKIDVKRRRIE
jgi:hypothetical protein